MNNKPIVDKLLEYRKKQYAPFSMPGHKYGRGFSEELKKIILEGDITEVEGLDNLHNATGIIKEAQGKLIKCYGSNRSYFLVNGSTAGNLTMIFSVFEEGDKILVERNCHKSIFNGILLRKLNPIYVDNEVNWNLEGTLGIDKEHLIRVIEREENIKGILLTYPNYFGIGIDIDEIVKICKSKGIKVLIDSAHGAHFGFHKELPKSPVKSGADMVVMSAHKTLPALTQTAYLHINNEEDREKVEFYLSIFMSTSPSYLFLSVLDYSRAFLEEKAEEAYEKLIRRIDKVKKLVDNIEGIYMLRAEMLKGNWVMDPTRIVICIAQGYKSINLGDHLLKNGVQAEMSTGNAVVLIPSPYNTEEDFIKLENSLLNLDLKKSNEKIKKNRYIKIRDEIFIKPSEVLKKSSELIDITKSIGRVAKENITPYPPGVPLILMGEKISVEKIQIVNDMINNNIEIIGLDKGKVKVLKEDEV